MREDLSDTIRDVDWRRPGIVAALVAAVALVVVLARIASPDDAPSSPPAVAGASVLRGVPENGYVLGSADAPARLTVYAYVTTPGFSDFVEDDLPGLVRDYVRDGKLAIELRTVSSKINDLDVSAAQLLQAAGVRDELWPTLFAFAGSYNGSLTDLEADQILRDARVPDRRSVLALRTNARVIAAIDRATKGARDIKLQSAFGLRLAEGGRTTAVAPDDVAGGVRRALRAANSA